MFLQLFFLIVSIFALYWGAETALESAEKIGLVLGLSPLIIGLFVVGFGTSLPELFVSHSASLHGQFPMAIGNIIGSNLANLFLIMGIVGCLSTIDLLKKDVGKQFIFHLLLTVFLVVIMSQKEYGLVAGSLLGAFFVIYMILNMRGMKRDAIARQDETIGMRVFLFLIIGFTLLYGGGELLVYSGKKLGELLGISTFVISAVFVAFGTSVPEFVTALVAIKKRKDSDLIVGNLIGSNIFNVALVLASISMYKIPLEKWYVYDSLTLLLGAVFLVASSLLKKNFGTLSGFFFLIVYGATLARWII